MSETCLRDVVSMAARNLGVARRVGSLLIIHLCPRAVSMHIFFSGRSIVILPPVSILLAESHLRLLDSIVRSAKRLCEALLLRTQKKGVC